MFSAKDENILYFKTGDMKLGQKLSVGSLEILIKGCNLKNRLTIHLMI